MNQDLVARMYEEGARTHPDVRLDLDSLRRFVEPLAASPAEISLLHAADIYLVCAALHGDAKAVAAIEREHLSHVPAFLARRKLSPAEIDDLTQKARERLFVGSPGRSPKLAEYAGRGPFGAWLRVLVLRLAGTERRRARPHETLDEVAQEALVAQSPEHLLARARWQGAFDAALRDAFASLSPEQRALFRFQFAKGMTLDQIALALGLHRATAARRIAAAREQLWTTLTRLLRERLKLPQRDLDALLAEWRSKLEVSLSGILRETAG